MLQIDSCTYHTYIPVVCTMPFGPGNMVEAALASRQFFFSLIRSSSREKEAATEKSICAYFHPTKRLFAVRRM